MKNLEVAVVCAIIVAAALIAFLNTGAVDDALDAYGEYKCELCAGDNDVYGMAIYCEGGER